MKISIVFPILALGLLASACGDDSGGKGGSTTVDLPSSFASWLGTYSGGSYGSCTSIYSASLSSSYPSGASLSSITLASRSISVRVYRYQTGGMSCYANVNFPITKVSENSSPSKLSYGTPDIAVDTSSSYSYSSTSSNCDGLVSDLKSNISRNSYSYYSIGSSRLEFTDPINGSCLVLTK